MVENDLKAYSTSKYSLILLDLNMPGMDGYETSRAIRDLLFYNKCKQPIISAVTGHNEQAYIDQAIMCGMNQVLSKPVNSLCLKGLIKEMGFPLIKEKQW